MTLPGTSYPAEVLHEGVSLLQVVVEPDQPALPQGLGQGGQVGGEALPVLLGLLVGLRGGAVVREGHNLLARAPEVG